MPLTHVQNQERQRARRRGEEAPEPESPEEEVGFESTYAPVPGQPGPVQQQPLEHYPDAELMQNSPLLPQPAVAPRPQVRPKPNVKVQHQTGPYPAGSIVPANCFADIQRLLDLGAIVYTDEPITALGPDQAMETAMRGARAVTVSQQGLPRAGWSGSIRDVLGPATPPPVPVVQSTPPGYSTVRTEWGTNMVVADSSP